MHILDTDTLTHLYAGHQRVINRLKNLEDPDVCTTIITKIELLRGRFDFKNEKRGQAKILHPLKVFFYYSHPPVLARIQAIKALTQGGLFLKKPPPLDPPAKTFD